jgi:Domain of unknown function (DUF4136)
MKRNLLIILAICLFTNCRKAPDFDQLSPQFIVSTSLDKNANFSSYQTFYISDSVANIGAEDSFLVDDNSLRLVQTVTDNLTARGYTPVPINANPDLGIRVSVVKDINVIINYYPGWWYGYWPWWGYYPPYYPWTTVYSYTTGTVIVDMLDMKNASEEHQYTGVWNTTALGAIGDDLTANIQYGINAINQGFVQSPYLKH